MKKIISALCLFAFAACNSSDNNGAAHWTADEKNAFMTNCTSKAEPGMGGAAAKDYCACVFEKVEKAYPKAVDAVKLTAVELSQMAQECLKK